MTRPPGAAWRVLIVEDEATIALNIQDVLEDNGFRAPWIASRLDEVQAIIDEHRPDAAVVDLNLGGQSGDSVAEMLDAAGIPFVFSTGYGRRAISDKWARKLVIQKPFAPATLIASVRAAMDNKPRL
ncbi:MAG: response regulator [Alphaproteobacteria bacterium]|nr:response regulator [Alphaproteobacteria bacterium]